jgi:protein-L-isoaspartate(D-aspartate) O-methyltransferase
LCDVTLQHAGVFDVIHVGAGAASVPAALTAQLRAGGRLIIPVECGDGDGGGERDQVMAVIDKASDETLRRQDTLGVRYVPLVRPSSMS